MNNNSPKCKLCRRAGKKLFLKGERCFTAKCAVIKKPYAPGQHAKPAAPLSEYGKQLAQKQTMKRFYRLSERQFKRYFSLAVAKEGSFADTIIGLLETRLDNVVYRLSFGDSRSEARQLVSHGFFLVNGNTVNIPSYQVKLGDVVSFRPSKETRVYVKNLKEKLVNKKKDVPTWLTVDPKKVEGKVIAIPTTKEVNPEANLQAIVEFYSR